MVRQVQPLRISKNNTPAATPSKMTAAGPLSEIGSSNQRRNSPSFIQATKKMIVSRESSPFTESSPPPSDKNPPRAFWSSRENMSPSRFDENSPSPSPSPAVASPKRRTSVERLKQAGRVKNSNIFALENRDAYDPSNVPIVERPSANRPLSQQLMNNSFTRFDSLRKENNPLRSPQRPGHKRSETEILLPTSTSPAKVPLPASPEKNGSPSPTKSSMARTSIFGSSLPSSFDPENGIWSDEERATTPRAHHRQNKSVTFRADPATVTEYEQQTPEPSVSAYSREGSCESDDFEDQDISFDRGSSVDASGHEGDDSFDEDLENAAKTPVVLPEYWSRMSPEEARTDLVNGEDDVFDNSPSSQRVASDSRPLPPLPGLTARRKSGPRSSMGADEILSLRQTLSVDEQERPSSKSSEETEHGMPEELTVTNLDTGEKMDVQVRVAEAAVEEDSILADLADFTDAPPRISRESILRNVRNSRYDFEEDDEADRSILDESPGRPTYQEMALMDPDQPIPSRENSRETSETYLNSQAHFDGAETEDVEIKAEPVDDDGIDLDAIPALADVQLQAPRSPSRMDDYERQSSVIRHNVRSESAEQSDDASHYSSVEPEAESTVLHDHSPEPESGKESLQEAMQLLTVKDYSRKLSDATKPPAKDTSGSFMGLPTYLSTGDYDFGMRDYITPSPPAEDKPAKKLSLDNAPVLQPAAEIVVTPTEEAENPHDDMHREVSPPGTPESVVHHSESEVSSLHSFQHYELQPESDVEGESQPVLPEIVVPDVPERRSTIRTGGKLRARPSATPADFQTMAEQRRTVSQQYAVPSISDAYRAASENIDGEATVDQRSLHSSEGTESSKADSLLEEEGNSTKRRESRKMKIDIPLATSEADDLTTGLDLEFDRVFESQKVGPLSFPPPSNARFDATSQQHAQHSIYSDRPYASAEAAGRYSSYSPHTGANLSRRTQKGYMMRQSTKVVVATNRNVSNESSNTTSSKASDGTSMSMTGETRPRTARGPKSSPRKPSAEQYLKTEPWVGQSRRKSVRNASAQRALHSREPAPPLPGQESALGVVDEDFAAGTGSLEDDVGEGVERGRLFVKVVGVKGLDLPMPRNDRLYFQLTLDNGLHCVTTSKLELGKTAPIGQEFELVVLNDLEFQLTLTTKLPPPSRAPPTPTPSSPAKSLKASSTKSTFSRFLTSPKKRAEKERLEREAYEAEERRMQREREAAQRKRASVMPTAWDLLHELVNASDGAFARSYINLKSHEKQCFGRNLTVDVPCYNEWALEKDSHVVNSVRSKRGANAGPIRRPPYVVGNLELQLLYVPKPTGATDEDMPKSMGSAIREMNKASEVVEVVHEGHLSQQGGDCSHWRRRFFRLQGSRLTAYHEHTHQKRAVINLSKASRLVDDKSTLVGSSSPSKSGAGRRKSAFAEEDEGYQYVEEGFRIRFANGETIDFYADRRQDKEDWMVALSQVIGKPASERKKASWTDLVLAREKLEAVNAPAPAAAGTTTEVRDFERRPVPTVSAPMAPEPVERSKTPPMAVRSGHRSRDAVKSMIF